MVRKRPVVSHGPRGVSLLEALVGLAIFSTVFVLMLSLFPIGANSVRLARETNLATQVAEVRLEQVRAETFDSIVAPPADSVTLTTVNDGHASRLTFNRQVLVTDQPASSPSVKNILVTVSWTSHSVLHSLRLETDVARTIP